MDPRLPQSINRYLSLVGNPRMPLNAVMALAGITHLCDARLQRLSGGETQRVLLARALLRDPDLLVLDEPVQGVEVRVQAELYELINTARQRQGCGVLLVSHDLHLVMANTDTVVCLHQHICCQGRPEEVTIDPAYLELFGDNLAPQVAIYTPNHDHHHDAHGNTVPEDPRSAARLFTPCL